MVETGSLCDLCEFLATLDEFQKSEWETLRLNLLEAEMDNQVNTSNYYLLPY
jgi:hypothetical protein